MLTPIARILHRFHGSIGALMRSAGLPLAVLVAGLALTSVATLRTREMAHSESSMRFNAMADRLRGDLARHLIRAELALTGLRAAHLASQVGTDDEFRLHVRSQELSYFLPAAQTIGWIAPVAPGGAQAFLDERRRTGQPDFTRAMGEASAQRLIISNAEPLEPNRHLLGLDLRSKPQWLEAAERALATRDHAVSRSIDLADGSAQSGTWAMMLPVMKTVQDTDGVTFRTVGLLFLTLDIGKLLNGIDAKTPVEFKLHEGPTDSGRVIFDSATGRSKDGTARASSFVAERQVQVGGDVLTLVVSSTRMVEHSLTGKLPWVVGASGIAVSILLSWASWLLLSTRRRARALARSMTADLQRMAEVVERTEASVIGLDLGGRVTWTNPGFKRLTGLNADACCGRLVWDLPEVAGRSPEHLSTLCEAIEQRRSARIELVCQRADGSTFWTAAELRPTRDADGQEDGFMCISIDISARKAVEQRLRERERLMRIIADCLPVRLSYWDPDLNCQYANRQFCEQLGIDARNVVGREMSSIFDGGRYDQMRPHVHRALAGEAHHDQVEAAQLNGETSVLQIHYVPDLDDGHVRGFVILVLDVTELRQARDMAVRASQAKSRFLSNMSHEIRTPLNAVLGMLSLLRGTSMDDRQCDYADKALRAARSLLSLLNDILDLSKIEAGKMTLAPRPFALDDLLRDLSVVLAGSVGDKKLEVLFDLDPRLPAAFVGDDMRLRQILINLGGNAIKFTQRGEVVVRLRLLAQDAQAARIEVAVCDTGVGMSPQAQAWVVEDFAQASENTAREYGGTGLGLGICQRLLGLMGSELRLESKEGQGSRFWFELSLPLAEHAGAHPHFPVPDVRKVLVVDDNAEARLALRGMARSLGWSVDVAQGGRQALAMIEAAAPVQPYDAVFIDWCMPDLDGWQTSLRIRQLAAGAQAPHIVMVTVDGRELLSQRPPSEQALLDGYLVKPVTASMMAQAVAEARGAGQARRTPAASDRPLDGLRVLVAEDNAINQQVARELLSLRGAHVEIACDGQEALERVRAAPDHFDVVLMDVQMPVMDGHAATRAVREELGNWRLPIIAMTANAMESDRLDSLACGMNDHVGKPFDIEDLVRTLLRHVPRKPSGGQSASAGGAARAGGAESGASAPPGPLALPVLDREEALARLGSSEALYERLMDSFRENLEGTAARLPTLLNSVPRAEAVRLMHTLKGVAATMGARQLSAAAAEAEELLASSSMGKDQGRALRILGEVIGLTLTASKG